MSPTTPTTDSGDPPRPPGLRVRYLVIAAIGWLAIAGWWTLSARAWFAQQRYREISATVEDVHVHPGSHDRVSQQCRTPKNTFAVVVSYRFVVEGRPYTSSSYDHDHDSEIFCSDDRARAREAELTRARSLQVFFDPDDPDRVVQLKQEGSEVIVVYAMLAIAAGILLWLFRRQMRRQRAFEAAFRAYYGMPP